MSNTRIITGTKPQIEQREVQERISSEYLRALLVTPTGEEIVEAVKQKYDVPDEATMTTSYDAVVGMDVVQFVWWEVTL